MPVKPRLHIFEKHSYLWAFEADLTNYKKAIDTLSKYKNVEVIQKGLWSSDSLLVFYNVGETDSTFIQVNSTTEGFTLVSPKVKKTIVPVTSLDEFFHRTNSALPTYIKMDIEGSEENALLGSKNIIKKAKPKLAIAVDHKPEDIYKLTNILHSMRNDYYFTLRQYDHGFTETVLYGV